MGEKINPTGRPRLAASVREGSLGLLKRYALSQAGAGADAIDLNVGVGDPGLEASFMARAVRGLDNVTTLPFLIDSPVEAVLQAGLEEYPARPMINSIPCIGGRMERALSMARDHGAAFVALLMDEHGVPGDTAGRIRILERILAAVSDQGMNPADILVDPVVMAESAGPGGAVVTVETIRAISGGFGLPTVLGLSNVSFGLPARRTVNRAFLVLASSAGLSSAIMDAGESDASLLAGASGLLGAREGSLPRLVSLASAGTGSEREQTPSVQQEALDLESAILSGSPEEAREAAIRELESVPAESFVLDRLVPAVTRLGRDYEEGRIFLPHLMAGADAVRAAFEAVRERTGDSTGRGTVLMATVEGDVHDIGKNIVSAVLAGHGWKVVDLGRNVPAGRLVDAVRREAPVAVGLSALLTPSLPAMREAVEAIRQAVSIRPVIIVGGAVVTPEFARSMDVLWGRDAVHGASVLDEAVPRATGRA
jgi:5-methyltetrahydrofolate--homocysteine methyltransferase